MSKISAKVDMSSIFQIKRLGKDADDLFWAFGKVHGLENIAYCDPADLRAAGGNPVKLQRLVNEAADRPKPVFASPEAVIEDIHKHMADYKKHIDKMNLNPSDRKKMLSLPFYLAKRQESPEPRRG